MSNTPSQIREKAKKILKQHGLYTIPIDVVSLASKLGIEVQFEDLEDDMSGFLYVKDEKATIVVNESHHPNRQRFTVGHEIGHYLLHASKDHKEDLFVDRFVFHRKMSEKKVFHRDTNSSAGTYIQEIQANRFAAEVLMPKALVEEALENEGDDIDFITDDFLIYTLARKFEVSEQALGYRLGDLGLAFQ